jgi:hypothetical protein
MDVTSETPITEQQVLVQCREDMAAVAKLTASAKYDAETVQYFAKKVSDEKEATQQVGFVYSHVQMSREALENWHERASAGLALSDYVEAILSIIFGRASAEEVFPIFGYHVSAYSAYLYACEVYKYAEEVIRYGNKVETAVKSITGMEKLDQVTTAWTVADDVKRRTEAVVKAEWVADYWRGNNARPKTMMAEAKEALFKAAMTERDFYFAVIEEAKQGQCSSIQAETLNFLMEAKQQAVIASDMAKSVAEDVKRIAMQAEDWDLILKVKQLAVTSTNIANLAAEDAECAAMHAQKKQKKWQEQQ